MSPIPEKMSPNLVCRFDVFCNSDQLRVSHLAKTVVLAYTLQLYDREVHGLNRTGY